MSAPDLGSGSRRRDEQWKSAQNSARQGTELLGFVKITMEGRLTLSPSRGERGYFGSSLTLGRWRGVSPRRRLQRNRGI